MMELNISKDQWVKVKLLDVFIKKEENDKENARNRFDRFLKVEHMDAESLHIKRWASQENGDELNPYFYKIFRKGQILFPTRNPHLRRTALASFDGICGEKTLTLEPNEKYVVTEFIPFLFHSESFYAHTTGAIIGSTNPHVRWRDVANYEFLLPPKAQQAQLAELLWAMDEVVEKEVKTLLNLKKTFEVQIEEEIHGIEIKGKTIQYVLNELKDKKGLRKLTSVGEILKGKGIAKSEVIGNGIPCVRYGELYTKHHRIIRQFYSFIDQDSASKSFKLQKNDILFAGSGETITEIGKSATFIDDFEAYVGGDTLIFRSQSMDGVYLGYLMNSLLVRYQLNKYGTGATVMHIYPSDLKMIKIPNQTLSEQKLIGNRLELIASNLRMLESQIAASKALQKSLINQIF